MVKAVRARIGRGGLADALRAFRLARRSAAVGTGARGHQGEFVRESHKRLQRVAAEHVFSRVAGAMPVGGNSLRLLENGAENYPAWLEAIAAAKHSIDFENYIITSDATGRKFRDALVARAQAGVRVRVLYDWMGCLTKTRPGFWRPLRAAGGEVRGFNRPRLDSPFGWLSRNHRKSLIVDSTVGFVAGLCIGDVWVGDPVRKIEPWRDTGVEIRGPAVSDLDLAFGQSWKFAGGVPLPARPRGEPAKDAGEIALRVIGSKPATMGLYRFDQLIAALARNRLWLTDAYFVGTTAYVQALVDAARDGVDVRLLVPGASDIPVAKALSRAGYRGLLEAGVRVFEWNGPMLHAKTAVADGRWARIGSTNLNLASWAGNWELDIAVEDTGFADQIERMFERDLEHATEIVLDRKRVLPAEPRSGTPRRGSPGRIAAGAAGLGSTVSAAITNHRALGPAEAKVMVVGGFLLLALSLLAILYPLVITFPLAALGCWVAVTLLIGAVRLRAVPPPAPLMTTHRMWRKGHRRVACPQRPPSSLCNPMIKIVSWNLLRLTGATLDDVVRLARQERPELLLMQEATKRIDELPRVLGGTYHRVQQPGRIHGLAFWSPRELPEPEVIPLPAGAVFQRVTQIIDLGEFKVANVHLSHGQLLNRRQLRRVAAALPPHAAVLGDYNLVGPTMLKGFRDVGPREHTHRAGDVLPLRIDRCLIRGLICGHAHALHRSNSDHRPIVVRLGTPEMRLSA